MMYGAVKPAKVTVYVKLSRVKLPPRIEGVQFGFGQTWPGAPLGLADRVGTVSCPFFVEATVVVLVDEKLVVWDSTRLPPLLVLELPRFC
jgi:hypothetical protein